jgi:alpha-tubulin suppressor-like RCC1 family protein
MHQYPLHSHANDAFPRELASLPNGEEIAEIWCGSEYTIAANEEGYLYGSGWNEHGNLGIGIIKSNESMKIVSSWQPVKEFHSNSTARIELWEGSLAAGGGHVVFIPKK